MSETKITRMLCQGCGADLDISDGIRFLNCNYCGAKLEVVQDESVSHTRVFEEVADDVKVIRQQNELERLDREWAAEREEFMVSDKNGRRSIPTAAGSAVGAIVAIVGGIVWMVVASQVASGFGGVGAIFPLFGLVFIGFGIASSVGGSKKAERYKRAKKRYDVARAAVSEKLDRG